MRLHGLKMNPNKCTFGESSGNFIGFLVHNKGIKLDKNKGKSISEAKPSNTKKESQRLYGKINFLNEIHIKFD